MIDGPGELRAEPLQQLWVAAEVIEQGRADKIIVLVASDFGRTPSYSDFSQPFNDTNGKDHWNVTSMLSAENVSHCSCPRASPSMV